MDHRQIWLLLETAVPLARYHSEATPGDCWGDFKNTFLCIIRSGFILCGEEAVGFRLLNRERTLMNMYREDTEDV